MSDQPQAVQFDRRNQAQYVCKHESEIAAMKERDTSIQATLERMDDSLKLILVQITKIPLLEEKLLNQLQDITRAHERVIKLDEKTAMLEKAHDKFKTQIATIGAVIVFSMPAGGWLFNKVFDSMERSADKIEQMLKNHQMQIDSHDSRIESLSRANKK